MNEYNALLWAIARRDIEGILQGLYHDTYIAAVCDYCECIESTEEDATNRRIRALEAVIRAGADIHQRSARGQTLLGYAAAQGDIAMVELLLGMGAAPNASAKFAKLPLAIAAERGHVAIVTVLLAAGGECNGGTPTPLIFAVYSGSLEVVKALVAAGANIEYTVAPLGSTALDIARALGYREIVVFLRDQGAREDLNNTATKKFAEIFQWHGELHQIQQLSWDGYPIFPQDPHRKEHEILDEALSWLVENQCEELLELPPQLQHIHQRTDCCLRKLLLACLTRRIWLEQNFARYAETHARIQRNFYCYAELFYRLSNDLLASDLDFGEQHWQCILQLACLAPWKIPLHTLLYRLASISHTRRLTPKISALRNAIANTEPEFDEQLEITQEDALEKIAAIFASSGIYSGEELWGDAANRQLLTTLSGNGATWEKLCARVLEIRGQDPDEQWFAETRRLIEEMGEEEFLDRLRYWTSKAVMQWENKGILAGLLRILPDVCSREYLI